MSEQKALSAERTDEQLVDEFRAGNRESFELLISRYSEKAYSLASRMCRNQEDAEEVLQDVFVTVYRKLKNFEGKSSFSSWLYRVTVNASLMKLRKRRQDKSVPFEGSAPDEDGTLILQTAEWDQSDELTLRRELSVILQGAIQKLPDEYRSVFVLRDVDGLTSNEVSKILGLSVPAVKSRLHRSRIMLRKKLSKFYQEYNRDDESKAVGNL